MSSKLMLLAAAMLRMTSEEYSNHGCNDMDADMLKPLGFTKAEQAEILQEIASEVIDDPDYEDRGFESIMDVEWMDYLALKLEQAAKKAA